MKNGFRWGEIQSERSDNALNRRGMTHFGYRLVPEREKRLYVKKLFDLIAQKYDFMNTVFSFGIHFLWKRSAVRMLELRSGQSVIDVCGGTGDLSKLAAKAVGSSGHIILYDINRTMMMRGLPKIRRSKHGNHIYHVQGDAEDISLPDQTVDAIMVGFGVRNLTHIEKGLTEMYRVLKPGGKLVCLDFSKPTAPAFRFLYDCYSFYIIPLLGSIMVGSRSAYRYLYESIRMFLSSAELTEMLKRVGFSRVTHRKMTRGIAVIHLAEKRELLQPEKDQIPVKT
jgi:demethylmenaquinone methyltransferase/2-methoxy-6-polyprenyl-1,4-benzoquinol methylase